MSEIVEKVKLCEEEIDKGIIGQVSIGILSGGNVLLEVRDV